jgi:hypothetical protein
MARTVAPKPRHGATKTAPVVRAQRIEFVDDAGRVQTKLAARPDVKPGMALEDPEGTPRILVGALEDGAVTLALLDRRGA